MVYKGETGLVIESKTRDGYKILLNRRDFMIIQHLEWTIFGNVVRKIKIIRLIVLDQLEKIAKYFFFQYNGKKLSIDDVIKVIGGDHYENIQKTNNCLINDKIIRSSADCYPLV